METIQMILSQKENSFSQLLMRFWICINFRTFSKKNDSIILCFSEITDHERRA